MNNQIKLKITGKNPNTYLKELIRENHAKVCYDTSNLEIIDIPTNK